MMHTTFYRTILLSAVLAFAWTLTVPGPAGSAFAQTIAVQEPIPDQAEKDQDASPDGESGKSSEPEKEPSPQTSPNPSDEPSDQEEGQPEKQTDESKPDSGSKPADEPKQDGDKKGTDDKKETDEEKGAEGKSSSTKNDAAMRRRRKRRTGTTSQYSTSADEFLQLFAPAIRSVTPAVVEVLDGDGRVALGAIIDPNGLIVTKASELKGSVACRLTDGRKLPASVFGVDEDTDLALLKVDATGLPMVEFVDTQPAVGRWVITPGQEEEPLTVGVVGVAARKIRPSRAMMGVYLADLDPGKKGVRVNRVTAGSPAEQANILVNDVIIAIDETETPNRLALQQAVSGYEPGDRIIVKIRRGKRQLELPLTLGDGNQINPMMDRSNQQNRMGSTLSRRRNDFVLAFQHDSVLQADECGGPVVDIDGQVVGLNIARAGRVDTLALPTSVVLESIAHMKSGDMAPAVVNQKQIEQIDAQLEKLRKQGAEFAEAQAKLQAEAQAEKAREEELARMLKEIQQRLDEIKKRREKADQELKKLQADFDESKKLQLRLEADRKRLSTGVR